MRKKAFHLFIIMVLSLVLCSCSKDYSRQTEKFIQSLEPELTNYFIEFSKEACDVVPSKITPGVELISVEFLNNSNNPSFETYLNDEDFFFKIGLEKEYESYSNEEINSIIKHAIENNLTIDFYFNNDEYTVYKIRKDGVTIDKVTGKDDGLFHEEKEYNIQ